LFFFKKKLPGTEIKIRFSDEEYEMLQWWTQKTGSPIDLFVAQAVVRSIPSVERANFANRFLRDEVMRKAADTVDDDEYPDELAGVFPLPPEAISQDQEFEEQAALPPKELRRDDHSCAYASAAPLVGVMSDLMVAAGGMPTCWHADQRGRPCHWPSPVARECGLFQVRVIKKRR